MSERRGFTLVEVLVAMTLLAIVMALALGELRFGARAWRAGNDRLDRVGAFSTSYRFLSQTVARAAPAVVGRPGELGYAFRGSPRDLRFVVNESPHAGLPGRFVVALRVVDADAGQSLRVLLAPFDPQKDGLDVSAGSDQDEGVLIARAKRIVFSYFGARRFGEAPEWRGIWDARDNMPSLVRLSVAEADGDWPELAFPLAIGMDPDCAINVPQEERKCRLDAAVKR